MAAAVAEIPAETKTAQQTEYLPTVPLDAIRPHPKNIRHNATADDELVASIKEQGLLQPLVVIPGDDEDPWLLIAGHRRLDGLKQADYTFAPVIVRRDLTTEAEQIAAMLVENGRREDLTPIEEAEGFDLLAELGWDIDQMVVASGRSKGTIKDRRRLTRLPSKAKTAVDTGQVTIEDGIRLSKLPAAEVKYLEGQVGSKDFRLLVTKVETKVRIEDNVKAETKRLRDAGIPELERPKDAWYSHSLAHSRHGMVRLSTTGKPNASDHVGCFAFVVGRRDDGLPAIWEVCTDPLKHDAELSAEQLARKEEREAAETARVHANETARLEREARAHAESVARQMRMDNLVAGVRIKHSQIDPVFLAVVAAALPELIDSEITIRIDEFHAAAGISDSSDYLTLTGPALIKALVAFMATVVECRLEEATETWSRLEDHDYASLAVDYFNALGGAGHEKNSADEALLAAITGQED